MRGRAHRRCPLQPFERVGLHRLSKRFPSCSVGLQPFERGVLHGLSKRFPSCSRPKTAAKVHLGRRMWVRLYRCQCMSLYLETSRNYIYTHGDVRKTRPARRTIWKGQPMLTFTKESYSTDLHHDAPQNHGPTRSVDSEVCPPSCRSIPDCQGRKSPTKSEEKMVKELPCCLSDRLYSQTSLPSSGINPMQDCLIEIAAVAEKLGWRHQ